MAELTIKWWNEQKNKAKNKVGGKTAPPTLFDKELKEYEAARTAFEKTPNVATVDAAIEALGELKNSLKPTITALEAAKFDALAKDLVLETTFRKELEALKKMKDELKLAGVVKKAANQQEAVYEVLWDAYEKQRDKLVATPSRQLYKSVLQTLDKLLDQADKVGAADPSQLGKYNKLKAGLNAFVVSTTAAQAAYEQAIAKCVKDRKDLLPEFVAAKGKLDTALARATQLAQTAAQAKQNGNGFALGTVIKNAIQLETAAQKDYDDVNDQFKPGTTLRDSLDIKAAKIHSDDSASDITPHFTALINANKPLVAVKKQLDPLIAAVKATKIG